MRQTRSIEDILTSADKFYMNYLEDIKELAKEKSWPRGIKREMRIAAILQYVLKEKYEMLIPPHRLQRDFKICSTESVRYVKSRIKKTQGAMRLNHSKSRDDVICYINFAKAYLTSKPHNILPQFFEEARKIYENNRETYEKRCHQIKYCIAALSLVDAGIPEEIIEYTFGFNKHVRYRLGKL
ncbi:MAG: hypothetical protein QW063_02195 [Candidatus Nanoarchaeia archaeon]